MPGVHSEAGKARHTRAVRTMLDRYKAEQQQRYKDGETITCWLCNQPIDMTILDIYDDEVFEPDHVYPVAEYPDLAADPDNLRPSHRGCNRERGSETEATNLGWTSEDWEHIADDVEPVTVEQRQAEQAASAEPAPSPYERVSTVDTSGYPDLDDLW